MRAQLMNTLLGHLLVWYGTVPQEALEEAWRHQQPNQTIGEVLASRGALRQEDLETVLRAESRLRGKGRTGRAHLLVVDDEPEVGALVGDILAGAGYSVGVAVSGAEALAALFAKDVPRPALIVLDLKMPGMSGFELLWVLSRALPDSIPVVVLSGIGDRDLETRVKALGAREFIAKPAPAQDLVHLIDRVLSGAP